MKGRTGFWLAGIFALMALMLVLGSGNTHTASQEERRIAEVLSAISGAGKVEVVLFYSQPDPGESAVPTGAVVVAEGASDLSVRLNLIRAMRTLLGLSENAVDVFAMEGRGQ